MVIKTDDVQSMKPFLEKLYLPPRESHKGQNGKLLIVGGSSLFHSASIWAAEVASHFVDLVLYSSTQENEKVFLEVKKKFHNGIVVKKEDLDFYFKEVDGILAGPGMLRGEVRNTTPLEFKEIIKIEDEPSYTYHMTKYIIENCSEKRLVLDAGTIQMMNVEWLKKMKSPAIVTPHQFEFKGMFGEDVSKLDDKATMNVVKRKAKEYNCVIVLKKASIFISDGKEEFIVEGGNAGLTKGGTGDILAGTIAALYTKNDPLLSGVLASWLIKRTADGLFSGKGYWYNISNLIENIADTLYSALKEE